MQVIKTAKEMQQILYMEKNKGFYIGYVPTMGYLHDGHLSLISQARKKSDIVVVSIFVNPTQFGPNEDLDNYPRDFERDHILAKNHGVDYLFYPDVDDMYPKDSIATVTIHDRIDKLCGRSRPGHFDGVATVLVKLFNIVQPNAAFFGMKDAQQLAVVEGLLKSFHFNIELVAVETVREKDGLAKSSRNIRLTQEERVEAPYIYKTLQNGLKLFREGEIKVAHLKKALFNDLTSHITLGTVDYIDILNYPKLQTIETLNQTFIIAIAVQFSDARLIDNIVIRL